MKTTLNTKRIVLDDSAANAVTEIMATLRKESSHLKINPSKVASWIVNHFYQNDMNKKVMDQMTQDHFNKRAYLKTLLNTVDSEEELMESFKQVISKIKPAKEPVQKVTKLKKNIDEKVEENLTTRHSVE